MANNFGFSSVIGNITQGSSDQSDVKNLVDSLGLKVISARVTDIILDENHPSFNNYGQWSSIGTIFFEPVEVAGLTTSTKPVARPLLPNIKNYPVINELVLLFLLPDKEIILQSNTVSYYYLNSINVWSNPQLNAYPNVEKDDRTQDTQRKSYQAIEEGQTRKVTNEAVSFQYNSPLVGGTFYPIDTIRPLLSFAGDVILEGRWGNSLRLGSTTVNEDNPNETFIQNNWSSQGVSGEPITILRNGQPDDASNEDSWIPLVEDINNDKSSIYLTSNQLIPLNNNITSYPAIGSTPPEALGSYSGSQVILNSNRLVFNSSKDSIILTSQNTIAISSINDTGLYSKNGNVNLVGKEVKLGDPQANQSVILGDNFISEFENLMKKLRALCEALSNEPKLFLSGPLANSTKSTLIKMIDNIDTYKSKITKTI